MTESFTSSLSPAECRAVLTHELPPPPRLRYRFDGRLEIVGVARDEHSFTVWQVPSGFRSPAYVADVQLAPADGGSRVDVTYRLALSRLIASLASGAVLAVIILAVIALLPAAPARPRSGDLEPLIQVLFLLSIAMVVLVFIRLFRRRRTEARDLVAERLRQLLRAR